MIGIGAAVGGLFGNALVLRWWPDRPLVATFSRSFAAAPLLVLLGIAAPLWLLVPAAGLALLQTSIFNVLHTTTLQTHVPDDVLATVSSMYAVGGLVLTPVGMAVAGPLSEMTSVRTVLLVGGAVATVITLGVLAMPSVRSLCSASAKIAET